MGASDSGIRDEMREVVSWVCQEGKRGGLESPRKQTWLKCLSDCRHVSGYRNGDGLKSRGQREGPRPVTIFQVTEVERERCEASPDRVRNPKAGTARRCSRASARMSTGSNTSEGPDSLDFFPPSAKNRVQLPAVALP